jgi:hypothetical protein
MHGDDRARRAWLDRVIANCDARTAELRRELEELARCRADALAELSALTTTAGASQAPPLPAAVQPAAAAEPPLAEMPAPAGRADSAGVSAAAGVLAAVRLPAPLPATEVRNPEPAVPIPAPTLASDPAPVRPEASLLSVQNVLLVLGGLLLGVAAVTFSLVAWTTFGEGGRALILGGGTGVALAVPVVLARRGLADTAETISAVALLLVGLDGFTAWSLGLFGVDEVIAPFGYAGLVCLATAGAAGGYRAMTRLAVPGYVALIAAQPVLPLIAFGALGGQGGDAPETGSQLSLADLPRLTIPLAGAAMLAVAVAVQNLAAAGRFARTSPPPLRALAWGLHVTALAAAGLLAGTALATTTAPLPAGFAAVALLSCAAVGVASAVVSGQGLARDAAAGAATVAVIAAGFRVTALFWPAVTLVALAAAIVVVAASTNALRPRWRRGPRAASAAMTALLAAAVAGWSLVVAVRVLATAFPAWQPAGGSPADLPVTWQLPVAIAMAGAAAGALLSRDMRHHALLAAAVLVVLVGAPALALSWWTRPVLAGAAALTLVVSSLAGPERQGYLRAGTGLGLAAYSVLTALPVAWVSAVSLACVMAGSAGVAVIGHTLALRQGGVRAARTAGAAAGCVLAALPATVASVFAATGMPTTPAWAATGVVAALSMAAATWRWRVAGLAAGAASGGLVVGVVGVFTAASTFAVRRRSG